MMYGISLIPVFFIFFGDSPRFTNPKPLVNFNILFSQILLDTSPCKYHNRIHTSLYALNTHICNKKIAEVDSKTLLSKSA